MLILCFFTLICPFFWKFIMRIGYWNKYTHYDDFIKDKWGKSYIKFPILIIIIVILSFEWLIKNINILKCSSYLAVISTIYSLIVIIQYDIYYNHYKNIEYDKEDKNTHINWTHLENAFTNYLIF